MELNTKKKGMDEQMKKDEAFEMFYDLGYGVEYQLESTVSVVGNYDGRGVGAHNADITTEEYVSTLYYITDKVGYKLYNLEFEGVGELSAFVVYAMENELNISLISRDDEVAAEHRKRAGVQLVTE